MDWPFERIQKAPSDLLWPQHTRRKPFPPLRCSLNATLQMQRVLDTFTSELERSKSSNTLLGKLTSLTSERASFVRRVRGWTRNDHCKDGPLGQNSCWATNCVATNPREHRSAELFLTRYVNEFSFFSIAWIWDIQLRHKSRPSSGICLDPWERLLSEYNTEMFNARFDFDSVPLTAVACLAPVWIARSSRRGRVESWIGPTLDLKGTRVEETTSPLTDTK